MLLPVSPENVQVLYLANEMLSRKTPKTVFIWEVTEQPVGVALRIQRVFRVPLPEWPKAQPDSRGTEGFNYHYY
jgi:hypothetical protein